MRQALTMGGLTTALAALFIGGLVLCGWSPPRPAAAATTNYYPAVALPGADGAPAHSQPEPATEPRSTGPAELLPDLRIRAPADLTLIGSKSEGTLRLKFTTVIWNDGAGPLEVRGAQTTNEALRVLQYVHLDRGAPRPGDRVGSFDFEHRHGHLHLSSFAAYELWALDDAGQPTELVAHNQKVGFCLMDNLPISDSASDSEPAYSGCDADVQGISVGYGDVYVAALYEQDLNVSDIDDGRYRLVNIVNPDHEIRELSKANNSSYVDLRLEASTVSVLAPDTTSPAGPLALQAR